MDNENHQETASIMMNKEDSITESKHEAHTDKEKNTKTEKIDSKLLLICFLLSCLFNVVFYKKTLGISYPIFLFGFYGGFFWYNRTKLKVSFTFGWLLMVPILLLTSTYAIYYNPIFRAINFIVIPVLMVMQTNLLLKGNQYQWFQVGFISDFFYSIFYRCFAYIRKPFFYLKGLFHTGSEEHKKYKNLRKVTLGLLLSIPLLIVIISLLSSADMMFQKMLDDISKNIIDIKLDQAIFRFIWLVLILLISFSYFWSFTKEIVQTTKLPSGKEKGRILDPVTVMTVLLMIDVIYGVFTVFQFAYLFGGALPLDLTYAEYARRGFGELCLITLINLGLLLLVFTMTKTKDGHLTIVTKVLCTILMICSGVIVVSGFYRMYLYEVAYDFTYLRILTQAFMVMLFVILIVTTIRIWNVHLKLQKYYLIIALTTYIVVNFVNIDVIIAKQNIQNFLIETNNHESIDAMYLGSLSYDAVPYLMQMLDWQDEETNKIIETALFMKREEINKRKTWQSFNLSKERAERLLYQYDLKNWGDGYQRYFFD